MKKIKLFLKFIQFYILASLLSSLLTSCMSNNKITSGTLAPKAVTHKEAVVQVYAARTLGVKKMVSVHTWISLKPVGSDSYTSYEIIGWRLKRYASALVERNNKPDRDW